MVGRSRIQISNLTSLQVFEAHTRSDDRSAIEMADQGYWEEELQLIERS